MQEKELLPYGCPDAKDYLPGAEVLVKDKNEHEEIDEAEEGKNENKH